MILDVLKDTIEKIEACQADMADTSTENHAAIDAVVAAMKRLKARLDSEAMKRLRSWPDEEAVALPALPEERGRVKRLFSRRP